MNRSLAAVLLAALVGSGCADTHLERGEETVRRIKPVSRHSTLEDQSTHARLMSQAYTEAARRTSRTQDVASAIVFLSAASVVAGALGSASDQALGNRALAGAGTQQVANKAVPEKAIKGLYVGAMRMNCISTMSTVGIQLLSGTNIRTVRAARALTYGAIEEARLKTWDSLTREVIDFGTLLGDLQQDVGDAMGELGLRGPDEEPDTKAINQYIKLLGNCLADKPTQKDATVAG